MVSHVSRTGREDSKLVGIVRVLQSESGRWAGCLRGLETRCPQAAADSMRHETPMADLQEAVPCAARSPYSMLHGAVEGSRPSPWYSAAAWRRLRCGIADGKSRFFHGAAAARSVEF